MGIRTEAQRPRCWKEYALTKEEAIRTGMTRYLGKSCKRGHYGIRQTSNGVCVTCNRNAAHQRKHGTQPSRMVDIDHLLELKAMRLNDYYSDL